MGFRKSGESPKGEYVRLLMCCWRTACWAAEAFGSVKAFEKKKRKSKMSVQGSSTFIAKELKTLFGDVIFKMFRLTQWHYWWRVGEQSGKKSTIKLMGQRYEEVFIS